MTQPDRATLIDRLTGGATASGEDPRAAQFVRGPPGALVGAAIAGRRSGSAAIAARAAPDATSGPPARIGPPPDAQP
jgi:hypothetical protein